MWVSQCCLVWSIQEQPNDSGAYVDVVQRSCPHCGSNHGSSWPADEISLAQVELSRAAHESSCVRGGASRRSGGGRRALFGGWCVSCEKAITIGMPITSTGGAWVHEGCS